MDRRTVQNCIKALAAQGITADDASFLIKTTSQGDRISEYGEKTELTKIWIERKNRFIIQLIGRELGIGMGDFPNVGLQIKSENEETSGKIISFVEDLLSVATMALK